MEDKQSETDRLAVLPLIKSSAETVARTSVVERSQANLPPPLIMPNSTRPSAGVCDKLTE